MTNKIQTDSREKKITGITVIGSVVNVVLSVFKVIAGIAGSSAAMIADGVHSISDLASDVVVLVFVKISSRGQDSSHDYGHGKFETMATLIVSLILFAVAAELMVNGIGSIMKVISGETLPAPGYIALVAAAISIISKEILYRSTVAVGKEVSSPVVIANAWHHRSDALSSVGSLLGIGGAILLGDKWTVLDPLASCGISLAIFVIAVKMSIPSVKELLDVSLPEDVENEILAAASSVTGVKDVHNLKTRRNGPSVIIEAHVVVDPDITLAEAHDIATDVETALAEKFGSETQTSIHLEPSENAK